MIHVIVEGPSDAGFVRGIARRMGVIAVRVHPMRGNRPDKLRKIIRALRAEGEVIILKDEHRNPALADSVEREFGGLAKVIRIRSSIESWILIGLCAECSEECDDPVKRLKEFLGAKGKLKSEAHYERLAEKIDIEKLKKHSKSFREFLKATSHFNVRV
jgi:hypothetical protein